MPWLRERYTHTEAHDWVGRVLLVTATVWVAVKAEQVVGYAALDGGLLGQLYVAPGYQRQGIGTQLLTVARAAAGSPNEPLRVCQKPERPAVLRAARFYPC